MILFKALFLTIAVLPVTLGLSCCDSTKAREPTLEPGTAVPLKCDGKLQETHPRKRDEWSTGPDGKECDFCTIEAFFVGDKDYYVQSCGSYEPAEFEFVDAKVNNQIGEEVDKRKAIVANLKWRKLFSDFGVDLKALDKTRLKRTCKIHRGRSGYTLQLETKSVGIEEPSLSSFKPFGAAATTVGNGVPLDDVSSVLCACFEDDCNGKKEIIPMKKDLERENLHWIYGE